MFNLNFKKLLFNGIWNSGQATTNQPQFEVATSVVNTDGETITVGTSSSTSTAEYWFNTLIHSLNRLSKTKANAVPGQTYFQFGTGETAPTENDYSIETEATEITVNQIAQTTTATFEKNYNISITNTSSTAITIKEIVQVLRLYNTTDIAISRTAVNIEMAAGETKTIMVEIAI